MEKQRMPDKKILVCEDDERFAGNLSKALKSHKYDLVMLVDNPFEIISKVEETIKKENPDYIVSDGLNGHCFKVLGIAKKTKPDILPLVLSGNIYLKELTEEKGYSFIDKMIWYNIFDFLRKNGKK